MVFAVIVVEVCAGEDMGEGTGRTRGGLGP